MKMWQISNPPAPKVLGRDLPDGTRKRLQVYLAGGGAFFGQNLLFLIGRDARLQKTLEKTVRKTPVRERARPKSASEK